jgi:hypothetical protein
MGHSKIHGVQTDETIVEAVNKQLNSNTRQVQTRARPVSLSVVVVVVVVVLSGGERSKGRGERRSIMQFC